jgi:hypothetical protein
MGSLSMRVQRALARHDSAVTPRRRRDRRTQCSPRGYAMQNPAPSAAATDYDVVVVGAGVSGLD